MARKNDYENTHQHAKWGNKKLCVQEMGGTLTLKVNGDIFAQSGVASKDSIYQIFCQKANKGSITDVSKPCK
jgi:hypothetical protein